jgi:serine/threonine-protein kinase
VRRSDGQLTIKVLDFGISKVLDAAGSDGGLSMTKTTAVMGSPLYMSPEQMRSSRDVDARTDIWALGVILFELLAGATPFDGSSLTEVAVKVATEPPPPLRLVRPDVPPGLEAVIAGCLQKDPRARYAHVGQVAAALAPFASPRGRVSFDRLSGALASGEQPPVTTLSPGRPPSHGSGPMVIAETVPPVGRTADGLPRRSSTVGIVAVAAAALVLVGGGAIALRVGRRTPAQVDLVAPASPGSSPSAASQVLVAPTVLAPPPPSAVLAPPPAATLAVPELAPSVPVAHGSHPEAKPKVPAGGHGAAPETVRDAGAGSQAAAAPAANCTPPYFIDSAGHRQYKPECL